MVSAILNFGWTDVVLTAGWFGLVFALVRAEPRTKLRQRARVALPE